MKCYALVTELFSLSKKLIIVMCILICGCTSSPTTITGLEGKQMPSFKVLLMNKKESLITSLIPANHSSVLMLFSPECSHCRKLTKEIISIVGRTKDVHFLVISPYPFIDIQRYYAEYKISKYSNRITVAQDPENSLAKYIGANSVPTIAIYDNRQILKQVLMGYQNKMDLEKLLIK